jgi:alpha-methylacyl-CoA racemase
MAPRAGHDINYIALAGPLAHIGRAGQLPTPPLNLRGDFGGGGLLMAFGIACALTERARSGEGQVIDAAMVDGAAVLSTFLYGMRNLGVWQDEPGTNMLDTGAHFYDVYETSDAKFVSIGSIEPQFYAELLRLTGLDQEDGLPFEMDRTQWPAMKDKLSAIFKSKTRDEWCALMEHTDVCFAPVLSWTEAPEHPHNKHRGTFTEVAGVVQPAPGPRMSRTPGSIQRPPPHPGQHTDEVLGDWGFAATDVAKLREAGAIK